MTDSSKEQMAGLVKKLNQASNDYYLNSGETTGSDTDFDKAYRELLNLEQAHPELLDPNSPTQRVGPLVSSDLPKVTHVNPMLSMGNVFNNGEMGAFVKATGNQTDYYTDVKYDGLALSIIYRHGNLVQAGTRGDGIEGEDVLHNAKTISGIPLFLTGASDIPLLEVRGEVMVTKKAFAKINEGLVAAGKKPYVNPRNCAAGSLRLLDPKVAAGRGMVFMAYGSSTLAMTLDTHSELMCKLGVLGFNGVGGSLCSNAKELGDLYNYILRIRDNYDYEIDGFVIKVDNLKEQRRLGESIREPRWATAYKFPADSKETVLKDVIFQIGRTGFVCPVAIVEPVGVGGVTVTRVTLHNEAEIKRLGLTHGATVTIKRAGDVIPKLTLSVPVNESDTVIPFIQECPLCGSVLVDQIDEAAIRCPAGVKCPGQKLERFKHFTSRIGMNVVGLSEKGLKRMIESGGLNTFDQLYTLDSMELAKYGKITQYQAEKLRKAIVESMQTSMPRMLVSLGIHLIGESTARTICEDYMDFDMLFAATVKDLCALKDVGEETALSIVRWFDDEDNRAMLTRLLLLNFRFDDFKKGDSDVRRLIGKTICLTGRFSSIRREDIKQALLKEGAKVSGNVSTNTDFLIAGTDAGSKLAKAIASKVRILDEDEIVAFLSDTQSTF